MIYECEKQDRIIDAECCYDNGRFFMGRLPSCLPKLFTVRFTAPADYNAGDLIIVDKQEYPVFTSQMEAADTGIFKAGVVMLCEIDRDRDLAFIRTGGGSGQNVEFQTSDLVYYIDPLGDDSPTNPGGQDSPFRTLAGAGRAAWQNIVMNPLGRLVFSFNPGTYDLSTIERHFMTGANHPFGLVFKSTNTNEKALINSDQLICRGGIRTYEDLILCSSGIGNSVLISMDNSYVLIRDVELVAGKGDVYMASTYYGGSLRVESSLTINGNEHPIRGVFYSHSSVINVLEDNTSVSLKRTPSTSDGFAVCAGGYIQIPNTAFTGAVSGKRYNVFHNGVINTRGAGPNYFPGTAAGTTATGGLYI